MSILKLKPSCKDYLWGGSRLIKEYGKEYEGEVLAETWELSCHPDNRYALKNEGQYGKTEMWYVMDAGKDAFLYYGFQREITKEEFAQRIREDTLLEVLNAVPVQKGDVLFIESGTIHAIGKDILIAEIQQNSNVTYQVYDYGRVGKDGKKRDLHIEKALAVTNRIPIVRKNSSYPHAADCDYFTVDKLNLDGRVMQKLSGKVSEESFASILILDGEGTISDEREELAYHKGDSFFLSAGSGAYTIEGSCDAQVTTIREKAAQVRIGIDIGGADTRIGLVDVHQKLIAWKTVRTNAMRPAKEVIREIGRTAFSLLEEQGIAMEQCVGAGIGVPGTVDRKNGVVRYSNNIKWEDVDIAKEMGACLPIPIYIANDADCAALGEAAAGAGRGCLEAYASVPALIREALAAAGKELTPEEIFAAAKEDPAVKEVVDTYIRRLGTGIVNAVNIFRPRLVLLGGRISEQGDVLIKPLEEQIRQGCFGGEKSGIPEIRTAVLGSHAGMIGAASLI